MANLGDIVGFAYDFNTYEFKDSFISMQLEKVAKYYSDALAQLLLGFLYYNPDYRFSVEDAIKKID